MNQEYKAPVQATSDVTAPSYEYNNHGVDYKGRAIIICNTKFTTKALSDRPVALLDVERLRGILATAGFNVTPHLEKTTVEMTRIFQDVARENLSAAGCLLCVISSHGTWDVLRSRRGSVKTDVIYGTDGPTPLKTLLDTVRVQNAPSLKDKPKIFLLQHCRGDRYPANMDVSEAGGDVARASEQTFTGSGIRQLFGSDDPAPEEYGLPYLLPIKRDFFLHYATIPGYVSFKQGGIGTPFLKAWCDVLSAATGSREIHDLATIVNAQVAQDYYSNAPSKKEFGFHLRKQMPQIVSMLTRDFYIPVQSGDISVDLASDLNVKLHISKDGSS